VRESPRNGGNNGTTYSIAIAALDERAQPAHHAASDTGSQAQLEHDAEADCYGLRGSSGRVTFRKARFAPGLSL
jgi:hypothetical protein